jgi:hypothetical protein
MLGTANGAVDPRIRASLHYREAVERKGFGLLPESRVKDYFAK